MNQKIIELRELFAESIEKVNTLKDLEELRVSFLGKKGHITLLLRGMADLTDKERLGLGKEANDLKKEMAKELKDAREKILLEEIKIKMVSEKVDVTLPGREKKLGSLHPITQTMEVLKNIFLSMGFDILNGPEIESVFRNFDALNVEEGHPSREESDTFYIDKQTVLRTHTSPVQVRTMETGNLPVSMVSMGKVYRPDYDVSHTPMFHQVEGLVVGPDITFSHLKGVLESFLEQLFEGNIATRLRPHYFPFTEPSAEVDISCVLCGGSGCRVCKNSGWLEILGAGMVSPYVLERFYDLNKVKGFAFGAGIERIAMLKYGIEDIRLFYENDLRFLKQFGFLPR